MRAPCSLTPRKPRTANAPLRVSSLTRPQACLRSTQIASSSDALAPTVTTVQHKERRLSLSHGITARPLSPRRLKQTMARALPLHDHCSTAGIAQDASLQRTRLWYTPVLHPVLLHWLTPRGAHTPTCIPQSTRCHHLAAANPASCGPSTCFIPSRSQRHPPQPPNPHHPPEASTRRCHRCFTEAWLKGPLPCLPH